MKTSLTEKDFNVILESLKYTRLTFENYQKYPSHEFRLKQIDEVNSVIEKVKQIRNENWN